MSLFNTALASFLPQRAIGPFRATVTVEEVATDTLEITQHPVQQGASITDHAYNLPATVSVQVLFSADTTPLSETYTKLRQLQSSRVPFTLVTGKRTYRNMLIKSLGQTNDAMTENILSIRMDLQEVFITALQVVTVPERSKQSAPGTTGATENAGQQSAQQASAPRSRSALAALAGR
jgi:hypothetical protein